MKRLVFYVHLSDVFLFLYFSIIMFAFIKIDQEVTFSMDQLDFFNQILFLKHFTSSLLLFLFCFCVDIDRCIRL